MKPDGKAFAHCIEPYIFTPLFTISHDAPHLIKFYLERLISFLSVSHGVSLTPFYLQFFPTGLTLPLNES